MGPLQWVSAGWIITTPDTYRAEAALFQMNASGPIVQIALEPPETAMSTERYRTWYIQRGALGWFNQDYLDRQEAMSY